MEICMQASSKDKIDIEFYLICTFTVQIIKDAFEIVYIVLV